MTLVESPASAPELAGLLQQAALHSQSIALFGANSKRLMAGPRLPSDIAVSTARLNRILHYEPNDLTISVEAGARWADVQHTVAQQGQRIALDPPFSEEATVGGVIASNSSGPLRKQFGTARDLVIGMQFATLEGKLVRTGGMVVKNVAGLDMGKLLIGSFGTLAAITSINLRLHPLPEETCTFLFSFPDVDAAMARCSALREGVLRPHTLDLIGPMMAARASLRGYQLALQAAGSRHVLERYARELTGCARLAGSDEHAFWQAVREAPAEHTRRQPDGVILRISTPLSEMGDLLRLSAGACIVRAGNGIAYLYLDGWREAVPLLRTASERHWSLAVEYAPDDARQKQELWPASAQTEEAFAIMKSVKQMFDPHNLLNRSRLYGRL